MDVGVGGAFCPTPLAKDPFSSHLSTGVRGQRSSILPGVYAVGKSCASTSALAHTSRSPGPHRSSELGVEAWGLGQLPRAMLHRVSQKRVLAPGLRTSWSCLSIVPHLPTPVILASLSLLPPRALLSSLSYSLGQMGVLHDSSCLSPGACGWMESAPDSDSSMWLYWRT